MKLEGTKEEWVAGLGGVMLGAAITCSRTGHKGYGKLLAVLTAIFALIWQRVYPRRRTEA